MFDWVWNTPLHWCITFMSSRCFMLSRCFSDGRLHSFIDEYCYEELNNGMLDEAKPVSGSPSDFASSINRVSVN